LSTVEREIAEQPLLLQRLIARPIWDGLTRRIASRAAEGKVFASDIGSSLPALARARARQKEIRVNLLKQLHSASQEQQIAAKLSNGSPPSRRWCGTFYECGS